MTINIGKHIFNLLKEHECVVLPNLGAFVLKNKAAHISNGQIFPSSKTIVFNKNIIIDDSLLTSCLVNKESLNFIDSKLEVTKYINQIKFDLTQKAFFDVESIGRFKSSTNNEIDFVAKSHIENLDKNSYGLGSLNIFPVQREIITNKKENVVSVEKTTPVVDKEIVKETVSITKTRKIRLVPLVGLAASILLMITIGSLMLTNTSFDNLKVQNANVLNFLVPNNSNLNSKIGVLKRTQYIDKVENDTSLRSENFVIEKVEISEEEDLIADVIIEEEESLIPDNDETITDIPEVRNEETNEVVQQNLIETETASEAIENIIPVDQSKYADILQVETTNPKGYYVIIGAYSSVINANKAKRNCKYDNACQVFKTKSGMYRVGVYASPNKDNAIDVVEEFKKSQSKYWLMENI